MSHSRWLHCVCKKKKKKAWRSGSELGVEGRGVTLHHAAAATLGYQLERSGSGRNWKWWKCFSCFLVCFSSFMSLLTVHVILAWGWRPAIVSPSLLVTVLGAGRSGWRAEAGASRHSAERDGVLVNRPPLTHSRGIKEALHRFVLEAVLLICLPTNECTGPVFLFLSSPPPLAHKRQYATQGLYYLAVAYSHRMACIRKEFGSLHLLICPTNLSHWTTSAEGRLGWGGPIDAKPKGAWIEFVCENEPAAVIEAHPAAETNMAANKSVVVRPWDLEQKPWVLHYCSC